MLDKIMDNLIEIAENILSTVMLAGFMLTVMIFSLVLWIWSQGSPALKN